MIVFHLYKRSFALVVTVILMLVFVSATQAQDQTYYRWADDGVMSYTCAQTGPSTVEIDIDPLRNIEYNNLPADAQLRAIITANGVTTFLSAVVPLAPLVGTGTQILGPFGDIAPFAYPIAWEYKLQTIIGGVVVYESSQFVNCAADGSGPVVVVNRDVTGVGDCVASIPAGAVQGRMIETAQAYFAPDESSGTNFNIPVGTSWWILEARSGFYKLFITCGGSPVWVRSSAVGPNFDIGGAPLPNAEETPSA
jgi:hypothetical protein